MPQFSTRTAKFLVRFVLPFSCLVLLDLLTKAIALEYSKVRFNPGVAFSTFADNPIAPYISGGLNILVALTLILIAAVHYTKMRMLLKLGVLCVSSGALSNALDRIIQFISTGHPYVTDFIEYPGLFTGNLADIYVVVGAIWLGFGIIRQYLR